MTPRRHSPTYLIFCMHASMSRVVSISGTDEAVRPKLQSRSDKIFGHWSDFCGRIDLQVASESKRGYTVSPSRRYNAKQQLATWYYPDWTTNLNKNDV